MLICYQNPLQSFALHASTNVGSVVLKNLVPEPNSGLDPAPNLEVIPSLTNILLRQLMEAYIKKI